MMKGPCRVWATGNSGLRIGTPVSTALQRDQLIDCYVLHRRDYSNSSLLLELFSRLYGRLPAIAKGARRKNNPAAALLQPFKSLSLTLTGRGEVKTVGKIEDTGGQSGLQGKALYCGLYLNELLTRLLEREDPHERLFDHYRAALRELSRAQDLAPLLRRFELRLLEETGYAMVLDREGESGGALDPLGRYDYDPERGPVERLSGSGGFSVSGATLLGLAGERELDTGQAREARELMRRVLAHHLGGRPLKSRELFIQLFAKSDRT